MSAQPASTRHAADSRPPLLMLCHRLPYPPNKGDKIRSWHLLQFLAQRYRVYLATFVDDAEDWQHVAAVRMQCADCCVLGLSSLAGRCRSAFALASTLPLSVAYYRSDAMQRWVEQKTREQDIRQVMVFSSTMGQFLPPRRHGSRTIVDFVDVDSDKWRQYARSRRGPVSWLYSLEAHRLADYETRLSQVTDASLFVSRAESDFFSNYPGVSAARCGHFNNGVDTAYFNPDDLAGTPVSPSAPELVFTGAMDYWPNVDAACFFAREILPLLRGVEPQLRFTIVGGRPTAEVRALGDLPGVTVTGRVPDVRPYIARATAAVAPMRVARGVQNKVLEAMAMARPVLVSAMGLEGIDAEDGVHVLVADTPQDYLRQFRRLYVGTGDEGDGGRVRELGPRARELVMSRYAWSSCLAKVQELLASPSPEPQYA